MNRSILTKGFWQRRIRDAYWMGWPDPVRGAIARQSPEKFAQDWAWSAELLRAWVPEGSRVLEVGCGTGEMRLALPEPVRYVGFDVVPDFVAEAERCYGKAPNTTFLVADICDPKMLTIFNADEFDVTVGRWVETTIGNSMPEDEWTRVRNQLIRLAPRSIWFSPGHAVPSVWERAPDGRAVHVQEAIDR